MGKIQIKMRAENIPLDQVAKLAAAGHTEKFIANFFGVLYSTWQEWTLNYPELQKAMCATDSAKIGKVERCLYEKATGYRLVTREIDYVDDATGETVYKENVKEYAPDMEAIKFYLTNKKPEEWKNRRDDVVNHRGDVAMEITSARRRYQKAKGLPADPEVPSDMDFLL